MEFDMEAKFANLENRLSSLETGFAEAQMQRNAIQISLVANTASIAAIEANTAEIVELFRDAKVGAKFIKFAISIAKGIGTLGTVVAVIWALVYAWKSGGAPPIPHG